MDIFGLVSNALYSSIFLTFPMLLISPFLIFFFIYLWLCWVFFSVWGLSLVAASGGHSSSQCMGLSLSRPLLLRSTGSRRTGSVIVAHRLNCSAACGIFPNQGSNPCPLHWQADSQPLRHQGSPLIFLLIEILFAFIFLFLLFLSTGLQAVSSISVIEIWPFMLKI